MSIATNVPDTARVRSAPGVQRPPLSRRIAKRTFDLVVAIPLALVTLPVVALLAFGSLLSFRAWPFFSQSRIGRGGRPFWFVKVRSLPASAPSHADKYVIKDIENSGFGRFIRKTHLDELPQLWLVVTGRMSIVGPRPEMPHLAGGFDPAFAAARETVRPGCTGFWQVSPAAGGLISEGSEYDLYYLKHQTLRFDLWIIVRTLRSMVARDLIPAERAPQWVLGGADAHREDDDPLPDASPEVEGFIDAGALSGIEPAWAAAPPSRSA